MTTLYFILYDITDFLHLSMFSWNTEDENGAFSGSMFQSVEGQFMIYYTCVDKKDVQRQCVAYSIVPKEGHGDVQNLYLEWEKSSDNPLVEPSGLPRQFRDPFVWTERMEDSENNCSEDRNGNFNTKRKDRMIVASQKALRGLVVMYEKDSTASVTSWRYVEELWSTDESYTPNPAAKGVHMVECPDFFPIMPNGDVYSQNTGSLEQIYLLKYSLMETRLDYYELGTYQNKRFSPNGAYGYIDNGVNFAYYASKTFWDSRERRRVMWGWSSETDQDFHDTRDWQGVMALPRVVEYDSSIGVLRMYPIAEVEHLHNTLDIESSLELNVSTDDEILIYDLGLNSRQLDLVITTNLSNIIKDSEFMEVGVLFGACDLNELHNNNSIYTLVGAYFDFKNGSFYTHFNTKNSGGTTPQDDVMRPLPTSNIPIEALYSLYEEFEIRILIDHSIIEVFFGKGLGVSTLRVYSPLPCSSIGLYSKGQSSSNEAIGVGVEAFEMEISGDGVEF